MELRRCGLLVVAAACGALGQALALRGTSPASFLAALAVFSVGGWCLSAVEGEAEPRDALVPPPQRDGAWSSRAWLATALALAVAAAAYVGEALSLVQLVAWVAALAALFNFARSADAGAVRPPEASPWTTAEAALVLGLTAVSLALRLWRLAELPPLVWDDEILYLHDAIVFFADHELPSPFASGSWGSPFLHAYTIRAATALVADRALALRLVSALPGALAVPFLYLALRELFDRRFASFGALLLALSAWAILLSRHGYVWAINGFTEALVLWALARGLRRNRLVDFVVAGVALGIGVVYSYAAALMPLVVVAFVAILPAVRPGLVHARRLGLAVVVLAATITAAPRLTAMLANPEMRAYQERALLTSEKGGDALAVAVVQLAQIAVSFNRSADHNPLFVPGPYEPLLDPISAAALGLGFFWALASWRRPGAVLLLLTFVVMLLPSALGLSSTEWATAWRACGTLPGLFGLAAAPFAIALGAATSRPARVVVVALLAPLLALAGFINLHAYFIRHPSKAGWYDGATAQRTRATDRILGAAPGERMLLNWDVESDHLRALVRGRRPYEIFAWPDDEMLPSLFGSTMRTTVLAGSKLYWEDDLAAGAVLIELLQHYYPGGLREDEDGPGGRPMLSAYTLEPQQIRAAHGLQRREVQPGFELSGTLIVPRDATYAFAAGDAASATISIDGEPFAGGFLTRGLHGIAVRVAAAGTDLRWSIDGDRLSAIPAANLLRQGLPVWGLLERGAATAAHPGWQRWVPLPWYAAPERSFGVTGDSVVQWNGEVDLAGGEYNVLVRSGARISLWLDDAPLVDGLAWPEWERVAVKLAPGWHRLRVESQPPIERRDLQLFWIDAVGRPGLFGGRASRYP